MFIFRDNNNPLETCRIELSEIRGSSFPGLYEIGKDTVKIWFLLNCISPEESDGLLSALSNRNLHVLKITTNQGNYLTCFQADTVSPIGEAIVKKADGSTRKKPYLMVPNGLLMMESQNWIEDKLVDSLDECVFNRAVFSFLYLPFWFNQSISINTPETIQVGDRFSISFYLEEYRSIHKFSLKEKKEHFSRVVIESTQNLSILEFYNIHRDLILLFRFCTGIKIPKAAIVFEVLNEGCAPHRFSFHYIFPSKDIEKEPNANQYVKQSLSLKDLMRNPNAVSSWIDCVRTYQHAMELMGEVFYSNEIATSDRVLKLLQVFDRLNKAYFFNNKKTGVPCLRSRLKSFIEKYNLSFSSITGLDEDKICDCLKEYRNSESHGDCNKDSLTFDQMEACRP